MSECLNHSLIVSECLNHSLMVSECLNHLLMVSECLNYSLMVSECLNHSLIVSECFNHSLIDACVHDSDHVSMIHWYRLLHLSSVSQCLNHSCDTISWWVSWYGATLWVSRYGATLLMRVSICCWCVSQYAVIWISSHMTRSMSQCLNHSCHTISRYMFPVPYIHTHHSSIHVTSALHPHTPFIHACSQCLSSASYRGA